jgi:hypothetical protein
MPEFIVRIHLVLLRRSLISDLRCYLPGWKHPPSLCGR